jgi:hypothetical protein
MRAKPLEVEPKGWGDNVIRVTLAYMQQNEQKKT